MSGKKTANTNATKAIPAGKKGAAPPAKGWWTTASLVTQSALVVLPPAEMCDELQEIRKRFDKSFDKWPAHINLLWPFFQPGFANQTKQRLLESPSFLALRPFRVRLTEFFFTQGSKYVQVRAESDEDALLNLQRIIQTIFPGSGRAEPFDGHLSVGQCPQDDLPRIVADLNANWTPIEFTVESIFFIARNSDQDTMRIRETIDLPTA